MQKDFCTKLHESLKTLKKLMREFDVAVKKLEVEPGAKLVIDRAKYDDYKDKRNKVQKGIREVKTLLQTISDKGPDGEIIEIDFEKKKQEWNEFYKKYEIKNGKGEIVQIPENLHLTKKAREEMVELINWFGFDAIIIIPKGVSPMSLQENGKLNDYPGRKKEDKFDTSISVEDDRQMKEAYYESLGEETQDFQIIFMKEKDEEDSEKYHTAETKNIAPAELKKIEQSLSLGGIDINTFYIYQRYYYDKHRDPNSTDKNQGHAFRDHAWFDYSANYFLTKTIKNIGGLDGYSYCVRGYYEQDEGRLIFYAQRSDKEISGSYSIFTASLPFETM